jgi:hypothetical protein
MAVSAGLSRAVGSFVLYAAEGIYQPGQCEELPLSATNALVRRTLCGYTQFLLTLARMVQADFSIGSDRLVGATASGDRGDRDIYRFELHQLRYFGCRSQPDSHLRRRRRGQAGLRPHRQSPSSRGGAIDDDKRQLQQPAACQRLRLDRSVLCRPDWAYVQREENDGSNGRFLGQRLKRRGHRRSRADQRYLALAAP